MADTNRSARTPVIIEQEFDQPRSRISLAAVVGGALLALMVMLLLNLLTIGIGLTAIDPATEANPFAGVGTGTLIGILIANVLALFAGGWAAGRLANKPRGADASLHGLLTWALTTLLSFWLLSSAVGQLVSGVTGIVGEGLSTIGQGIGAVAPDAAQAVEDALADQGVSLESIRQEAQELAEAGPGATGTLEGTITGLAERFLTQEGQVDRQELIDALVANTELTEADAEERVDAWEQQYQEAVQALQEARQELEEAAQQASDAVGSAAIWAFIGLVIGAGIAVMGSVMGRPKTLAEAKAG